MSRCTEIIVRNYVLAILSLIVCSSLAEDVTLNVNVKRPVAVVSERFLSITLDPEAVFKSESSSKSSSSNIDGARSLGMAKALAPAYVRIGGPRSNSYVFERGLYPQETTSSTESGYTFSEKNWIQLNKWAERSGLNVIACIAPQMSEQGRSWDSRNALDLISFSDHMGYNTSWQLGYECQTRCDASGSELGHEVQRLRSMLDAFPRYSSTGLGGLVIGPDAVAFKTRQQQQFLQEYFNEAGSALSAVTWHPDFAGISLEAEGVSMHHDNLGTEKDNFIRIAGRQIMKKPLWLAESKPEECKGQFLGALVWARRLGNSAKLGVQVLMRQPENSNLFKPTPDYWVSVLHKMLVGREVLDTKIALGNRTHVSFYSQCTKPSSRYEKGSLTIFGVNLTPSKINASLKGLKPKVIHKYILLPGFDAPNRMFAETTLLNNELLKLVDGKEVPDLQPVVYSAEKGVKLKLPSGGIGFWVLPGLKIKACMEEEMTDKNQLRKTARHLEDIEAEKNSKDKQDLEEAAESAEKKLKQVVSQKRSSIVRRHSRPKEDEHEEPSQGEIKKSRLSSLELARRDLERLHRLMRKREHQPMKRKTDVIHGEFDKSEENVKNSEESISGKSAASLKLEKTKKSIRAKLEEYKTNLDKAKKKQDNSPNDKTKDLTREAQDLTNKGISAEKVIEALTLISKVENTLRSLEQSNASDIQASNSSSIDLNVGDTNDVTIDQEHTSNSSEALLDEVLNSQKSKRASLPTGIEEQLSALYQLLTEEKERREIDSRRRRDLEIKQVENKKSDSQLTEPTTRKLVETEQTKEHLKNPTDDLQSQKRQRRQKISKETNNSDESDFYGLQTQPPLANFPVGDVYIQADKVITDAKSTFESQSQGSKDVPLTVAGMQVVKEENNEWVGDGQEKYVPNEFYENVSGQRFNARPNIKNYGDLWEADLQNKDNEKTAADNAKSDNYKTEAKESTFNEENNQAKDSMKQESVNYYTTLPNTNKYDMENLKQNQQQMQYQQFTTSYLNPTTDQSNSYNSDLSQTAYTSTGSYYTQQPGNVATVGTTYRRAKRNINDMESVLRQEMINQDINNLNDCQCRVIRGVNECKDCIEHQAEFQAPMVVIPAPVMQYPMSQFYDSGVRSRREAEIHDNVDETKTTTLEIKEETVTPTLQNEETTETTTTMTTNLDTPKEEQTEKIKEEVSTNSNLQDTTETKTIESTTINMKDKLKLEDHSDKIAGNRLPRKVEMPSKYISKSKAAKKEMLEKEKIESNTSTNIPSTSTQSTTESKSKIILDENIANTRNVKEVTDQPLKISKEKSSKTSKEAINIGSSVQTGKVNDIDNKNSTNTNTKPSVEKSSKTDADNEGKNKRITKDINSEKKIKRVSEGSTTEKSKLNPSASTKITAKLAPTTSTLKDKNNPTVVESKNKAKNHASKFESPVKTRQARLTTKSEALKKEIENKRAKKMIDQSIKLIDTESAKFEEYQRKRRDQLEKLKIKLRAKRDKMLDQYKDELIEAINENPNTETRKLRRRDLLSTYEDSSIESDKDDFSDMDKPAYIMRYKPIKFISDKDTDASEEKDKYVPMVEIIKPNYKFQEQNFENKHITEDSDENNNSEISEESKKDTPIDIHFNGEMYDNIDEQDGKSKNKKRSPYSARDRYGHYDYKDHPTNYEMAAEEDSREYYSEPQYDPEAHNYPHVIYNKRGIVPSPYDTRYYDANPAYQQQDYTNFYNKAINAQKQRDLIKRDGFVHLEQSLDTVNFDKKVEDLEKPEREENEEQFEQQNQQNDSPQVYQNEENIYTTYQENSQPRILQNSGKPNNRKVRRSNLKIFEIDPSMYDEGDLDGLQDMYFKPSYRFSSRSYRHDPYTNNRYKRAAQAEKMSTINGPLSFSLGLEKSKMKQLKDELSFARRKRETEGPLNAKQFQVNKNLKKVFKNYDDKNRKFPKSLKYIRNINKGLEISSQPSNEHKAKFVETHFDDLRLKNLNINNHLDEENNKNFNRRKRSIDNSSSENFAKKDNIIDRPDDPEMDEIWNNIIEMKQDESLLKEYDRQKGAIMEDLRINQQNLQKYLSHPLSDEQNATTGKVTGATTQTNLETIIVDTIPKIETVITGGLKKAENLTGSFENFFETFNEEFEDSTESQRTADDSEEMNGGGLSHNVFKGMLGSVRKFFNLISGVTKVFQN